VLSTANYQLDTSVNVWSRSDFSGISYSDGDAIERRIESIVSNVSDLAVFSDELALHCTDWASTYHLSSTRANLLRPFQITKDHNVLEIGAGCGGLTRYLGECGANVLALEGSRRRSKIARARTRDLHNVAVLSETFSEFAVDNKFDVITLVGVLEYANLYIEAENPAEAMLSRVVSMLKPQGAVVIAIENQLGLKYFAGAPEDHIGVPMYGIEGRYQQSQPQTYGRKAISRILNEAGLTSTKFLAPFPDYKLPISIVTENAFEADKFDAGAFAWQSARRDPQLPDVLSFSPELVWPQIVSNRLGMELSNSFLILASMTKEVLINSSVLAYHYSSGRVAQYAKETLFVKENDSQISVNVRPVVSGLSNKKSTNPIRFSLTPNAPYVYGRPLSLEFIQIVSKDGWSVDDVGEFLCRHVRFIEESLLSESITRKLTRLDDKLPGKYFDVIAQNIIVTNDGSSVVIDQEWELTYEIELGFCLFRSVLLLMNSVSRFGNQQSHIRYSRYQFIQDVFLAAGFMIEDDRIKDYMEQEANVQSQITGKSLESFLDWHPNHLLQTNNLSLALDRSAKEIAQLNAVFQQKAEEIEDLRQSSSWKVTAPIRRMIVKFRLYRDAIRAIHRRIVSLGGYPSTLGYVLNILGKEGVVGLRNRWLETFRVDSILVRKDYSKWVELYSKTTDKHRSAIHTRIAEFRECPLISIVMPVYNPNPEWLVQAIDSVRSQLYENWELCIADDYSTDSQIRKILEELADKDTRIKVVFRKENGHISAASNSALRLAQGTWIALVDHDDRLSEDALFWVVDTINHNPSTRLVYSDEDKIDEIGARHSPYFKTDWNPDLFLSHNMFCHLGVYEKNLLDDVGGFRIGFEGSQDYDLALRCAEKVDANQILHIPRVLYHWRVHRNSTASSISNKPYARQSGKRALDEHFERLGIKGEAVPVEHGFRIRYTVPINLPLVTLIIPVRNKLELTRQCIESIREKTTYGNYEIVVVDNGSDDLDFMAYLESLSLESGVSILRDDRPFNFSALNNRAVDSAKGEIVGLINNDTEVITSDWLTEMVSHAVRPEVGAVGAKLRYGDGTLQHGGVVLGLGGVAGHSHKHLPKNSVAGENLIDAKSLPENPGYFGRVALISNFSAVTAACLVTRKSIYQKVGGLNEQQLGVAFNDVDFCCRLIEAGHVNVWTPYAELFHHESLTRGYEDTELKKQRFLKEAEYMKSKWKTLLAADPAYNPNLTLHHEDFSYAWPPRVELLGGS